MKRLMKRFRMQVKSSVPFLSHLHTRMYPEKYTILLDNFCANGIFIRMLNQPSVYQSIEFTDEIPDDKRFDNKNPHV